MLGMVILNTLLEMRQKLFEFYIKSLEVIPRNEDSDSLIKNEEYLSREKYIIDLIKEMPIDLQSNLISLLIIYYYSSILSEDDIINLATDELYELVVYNEKDYVISKILSDDNLYLYKLISFALDADIDSYDEHTIKKGKIEDFDHYFFFDNVKDNEDFIEIYKKFHPCSKLEELNYREYEYEKKLFEKYNDFTPRNLTEFIEVITIMKKKFTRSPYFRLFISSIVSNVKEVDVELFKKINLFMIKDYYMDILLSNENTSENKLDILGFVSNPYTLNYDVVNHFVDFEFTRSLVRYNFLTNEMKRNYDSVFEFDYSKTYGVEGTWREYNPSDKESIMRYTSIWNHYIERANENNNRVFIYYSVNENDSYSIPRLCIIVNEKNEIIDILGRDSSLNVEFGMLKTLKNKAKRFSNYDNLEFQINILERVSLINKKLDALEELTKEEIDFLFEIECEFDNSLLFHSDNRIYKIRDKANIKKCFAKYYDCLEEEVAVGESELNSNTKVLVCFDGFTINDSNCLYPNFKVVYGNLYAPKLENGLGLFSLEQVIGSANFDSLTNSCGFENLRFVRDKVRFPKLKDFSHINQELLSSPSIEYPDDIDPKKYIKK